MNKTIELEDKEFRIVLTNMFKDLKKSMNVRVRELIYLGREKNATSR